MTTGKLVRDNDFYGCAAGFELVAGQSHLNHDTCHGDSGGPVFGYVAKGGGTFDEYLIGITSRGIRSPDNTTDCGQGGIYTRVDGPTLNYLQSQHINLTVQQ
jgi:secreted trypsin-like serine protease